MITEWLLEVGMGLAEFFIGLMPDWEPPPDLADPDGMLASILEFGNGLGPWIDWAAVGVLALIPIAVWLGGLLWKLIRTIASHIPMGFGGSG